MSAYSPHHDPDSDLLPAPPNTAIEVREWRLQQLLEAGYEQADAQIIARRRDIDLHRAVRLVLNGCDPATAARILL